MQSVEILDIKPFMQLLFHTNTLDRYAFVSGELHTDMSYSFDGHINQTFFSEDEIVSLELEDSTYLPWHLAKEKLFLLIKGKKTPSQLKIVLKSSKDQTISILNSVNSSLNSNDIDGMYINVLFQNQTLNVIFGISYQIFTMDKAIETEFSSRIITLFKSYGITCK